MALAALFVWFNSDSDGPKRQLTNLFNRIPIGAGSAEAAKAVISGIRKADLHTATDRDVERWYVSSVPEILQGHWILVICVERDVVAGMRFGLGDDITVEPKDAPRQKGRCLAR